MGLTSIIRENMTKALKAGEKEEKAVYTAILSALTGKAKELQADLTPEQDIEVMKKLDKQNQESIDACPSARTDVLEKLKFEREIILKYVPKQMEEGEIKDIITGVLANLGIETLSNKDKGKVMKELMPIVKGKADGKLVSKVLESFLN